MAGLFLTASIDPKNTPQVGRSSINIREKDYFNALSQFSKLGFNIVFCENSGYQSQKIFQICKEHNILLLEDACQAIGGTYKGKPLGSIGDAGTFSFDFVKTITCGEGGVVMTKHADVYTKADQYSDHGHDHAGKDRGADLHPFVGYNFRISELHAAVGLAQIKRLDDFVGIQKKHYTIIREALAVLPEITFRAVPEGGVESYAFLNFFLPDAETASKVSLAFKANGIDACWNYFENNWHYIRKWNHLKDLKSLYPISKEVKEGLKSLQTKTFAQSDHFIGRNISCLMKLSWTEDEVKARAATMVKAVQSALI